MIISKTPYRISFFGGGSDYPDWYLKYGGEVLSSTINKHIYITCRYLPPFFKHKHRIVWSKLERVKTTNEIKHDSVRELLKLLKIKKGMEIHYDGDLPARSFLLEMVSTTETILKIDVVLSDMAENTTGNKNVDDISTGELCKKAMFFAKEILNKNGIFVSKIFMGSSFKEIISESKSFFKETRVYKPMSSKKDSKESFIICKFLR